MILKIRADQGPNAAGTIKRLKYADPSCIMIFYQAKLTVKISKGRNHMQAVLYTLVFPVLPYILWRSYHRERKVRKGEVVLRYLFYLIVMSCISAAALAVFGDEETSFLEKMDKSAVFALKYVLMELCAGLLTAGAEWSLLKKKYIIKIDWEGFASWKPVVLCGKYICPVLPYLLAVFVIVLNGSMMFDNVVWGDEAFSVNTAQNSMFGVMQIVYYLDTHPPLYYYWLKLWGDLFGFSIPVCHLASLIPFVMGILLALFCFRKKFGAVPAVFFIVLSGLGVFCLQYNLEIRMYALTFFCLAACFWCSYRVVSGGKKLSWAGMVFFGLVAAYSHYYGLVAGGILVFFTGAAVWLRYRGKTWIKGLIAVLIFIAGYSPWLVVLYKSIKNVSGNWWVTEILKPEEAFNMVFFGGEMVKITVPLVIFLCAAVFLVDSGIVRREAGENFGVKICVPDWKKWNEKTYAAAIGFLTVAGTIGFGYFLCLVMTPVLVARYLYPVSAVMACLIVVAGSRMLEILKEAGEREKLPHLEGTGKGILVLVCVVLLSAGIKNYNAYSPEVELQKERTQATLDIIGTPEENINMVTNGVKHLGWTVLKHYYPDNEIITGDYRMSETGRFWYFSPYELAPETLEELESAGMSVTVYGEQWIAHYPFYLYYMES